MICYENVSFHIAENLGDRILIRWRQNATAVQSRTTTNIQNSLALDDLVHVQQVTKVFQFLVIDENNVQHVCTESHLLTRLWMRIHVVNSRRHYSNIGIYNLQHVTHVRIQCHNMNRYGYQNMLLSECK